MEIKVGGRYKRVKVNGNHPYLFLGQEIIITGFTGNGSPRFKKKLRDGSWDEGGGTDRERFERNFKPFNMQMRNK